MLYHLGTTKNYNLLYFYYFNGFLQEGERENLDSNFFEFKKYYIMKSDITRNTV